MEFAKIFNVADTQLLLQCVQLEDERCGIKVTTTFEDSELSGILMFKEVDNDGGEACASDLFENIDQEEATRIYMDLRNAYLMAQQREEVQH